MMLPALYAVPPSNDDDEDVRAPATIRPTIRAPRMPAPITTVRERSLREPNVEETTALNPAAPASWLLAGDALPDSIVASLEPIGGAAEGTIFIRMTRTIIGRGERADIRLDDAKVSRKHAAIVYARTEFRIRDEGSANGTLLNGSRVLEYALRNGDELRIGDSVFRFVVSPRSA
jgi:hypothetical protein